MTNFANKTIKFLGGSEKRIRHRLGLGLIKTIKIDDLLGIAKILGYDTEFRNVNHSELASDSYHCIYTGFSKLAVFVYDYDIAHDADGNVTAIFEDRGEYADFGIGRIFAWMFKYSEMKAFVINERNEDNEFCVKFSGNSEAKIRNVLGLAERKQFNREEVLKLANLHGYRELSGKNNAPDQLKVYPAELPNKSRKHHFQMTVGENDMVDSIVEIKST